MFHIKPDGTPAYSKTFKEAFGFYEGRAAVEEQGKWFHILTSGNQAYRRRFSWCGNFQENFCVVRDLDGFFRHIDLNGENVYTEKYHYVGDFREGLAVATKTNGQCFHILPNDEPLNNRSFKGLGVYHKGYATAQDQYGWFHIDKTGNALYDQRYLSIEQFCNGLSYSIKKNGKAVRINTVGEEKEQINPAENRKTGRRSARSMFKALGDASKDSERPQQAEAKRII